MDALWWWGAPNGERCCWFVFSWRKNDKNVSDETIFVSGFGFMYTRNTKIIMKNMHLLFHLRTIFPCPSTVNSIQKIFVRISEYPSNFNEMETFYPLRCFWGFIFSGPSEMNRIETTTKKYKSQNVNPTLNSYVFFSGIHNVASSNFFCHFFMNCS